jgi:TatD DNase family protein
MLIDTHAHVNFNIYKDDADKVIRHCLAEKTWMIIVGTEYKTSKRALTFANKYERGVYASVGIHPIHLHALNTRDEEYDFTTRAEEFNYDVYEKLAKFEKVVALGEIGLDYYHISGNPDIESIKKKQQEVFISQLILARRLDLPVIIHCRQAHDDILKVLKDFKREYRKLIPKEKPWGVMHCFSGDEDLAWQYFSLGLLISFTGIITFSRQWDELLRKLPFDKFMIETDCPFMTPEPFRGQRNEPVLVKYVAQRIAEIKDVSLEKIAKVTSQNAKQLFKV